MFKGTNKTWKALALVLALCMSFSTMAVFADDPSGNTVVITTTKASAEDAYNANGTVTIEGTFGNNTCTDDVTILAVRDTAEQSLDVVGGTADVGAWEPADLQRQVIYIDQEAAVDGTFSFTFIPRTGVSGGTITVFVGGKDASPEKLSFTAKTAGPELVAAGKWYEGQPLVLNVNSASNGGAYGLDQDDQPGNARKWFTDVASITVTTGAGDVTVGKEVSDSSAYAVLADDGSALTIHGLGNTGVSVSAITTTSTSSDWTPASLKAAVAQEKKDAGTLSTDKTEYVVGDPIDFIGSGEDTAWNAAVDANIYAKVSETALTADAIDTEGTTTAALSDPTTVLKETYWATVKADYYTPSNVVSYTVKAPALVKAEAVTNANVKVAYSETPDDDETTTTIMGTENVTEPLTGENIDLYGAAVVALPPAPEGFSYTWTITQPDGQGADLPTDLTGASITLDRPNYDATNATAKSYTYTLTLAVKDLANDTWKVAEKPFTLSATRVGMKGVPVTIAPEFNTQNATLNSGVAKDADFILSGAGGTFELTWDVATSTFKAEAIAPGEYTITIVRPGYLVGTATIEVLSTGEIDGEMPELVAGDVNGDGTIDISDVSATVREWDGTTVAADINGDGVVDISDVSTIVRNWDATGTGTNDLE